MTDTKQTSGEVQATSAEIKSMLDEHFHPDNNNPTLEEINTGKVNFWSCTRHQIDMAVARDILDRSPDILEELEKL